MRRPLLAVASLLTASLAAPAVASAQEIRLTGPIGSSDTYYSAALRDIAARTDVHAWLCAGGTPAPEKVAGPVGAIGVQVTNAGLVLGGVRSAPFELRWGPWGQASMDGIGGRAEGGLAAELYLYGRRAHAPIDLRFGAGYGEDALGRKPHLAVTLSGGLRQIEAVRWPAPTDRHGDEIDLPQLLAGFRLFLSLRGTLEDTPRYWVTGGVEVELGTTLRAPRPSSARPLF